MKKALSILFAGIFLAGFGFLLSPTISASDSKKAVTFAKDVAPIFYKHCADCHRPTDGADVVLPTMTRGVARLDQREAWFPWSRHYAVRRTRKLLQHDSIRSSRGRPRRE